jgi:hypothetical protein
MTAAIVRTLGAILLVTTACSERSVERRFLSIGTAGTGGVYYPLGGALASRLSALDSTRTFTAEVTGGAVENINRVLRGEIDIGFVISTSALEAYQAGAEGLRIIAPLYPNLTHLLVPARSPVVSLEELRGRRISVGSGGSGTEQVARHMLEAYGLDSTAYVARYLSFSESAAALADNAIDGAILSVGFPASAVLEALTTGAARLLAIDSAHARTLAERHPYYQPSTIPAGAYPGQSQPIATVATMNWLVARADLDGEVVRSVLNLLRDDRETLRRSVEIAGQIDMGRLTEAPIPLHDATRAWLEERRNGN